MATAIASRSTVSASQYHALQAPFVLPTPQELFEFQACVLQDKGLDLASEDVDRLRLLIPSEPQMFLIIPRRPDTLDLDGLMKLVVVNGVQGENYLDVQYLKDVVEVPSCAHLLVSVEDGRKLLNMKPSISSKNIRSESRIAYSTWYGLIHGILFPCVLHDHNFDLCGSRYGSDYVSGLYLGDGGVPRLGNSWGDGAFPNWGAPSAGSVLGI